MQGLEYDPNPSDAAEKEMQLGSSRQGKQRLAEAVFGADIDIDFQ
jgi:hypothetical protein